MKVDMNNEQNLRDIYNLSPVVFPNIVNLLLSNEESNLISYDIYNMMSEYVQNVKILTSQIYFELSKININSFNEYTNFLENIKDNNSDSWTSYFKKIFIYYLIGEYTLASKENSYLFENKFDKDYKIIKKIKR